MTKQDRRDMFIAAALTGIITDGRVNPHSGSDRDYIVNSAITIANKIIDETDYVYDEDLIDDQDPFLG